MHGVGGFCFNSDSNSSSRPSSNPEPQSDVTGTLAPSTCPVRVVVQLAVMSSAWRAV